MKITTFNPMIISPHAEELVKVFEALGFEQRHHKTGINDGTASSTRMTDPNGFHVDVTSAPVPQDMPSIRMNVDHFDEAYELLKAHGFKNAQGDKITDTGTSHSAMMIAPSGFTITVAQHIK